MTTPTDDKPCVRRCVRTGTEELLPARHGAYCSRCWGRIDQALIQAPELAQHILAHVTTTGQGGDLVDVSKDAPLPFNPAAFADVNELYSLLVYWCNIWAGYLEVYAPAPAARAWRRDSGTITGLPADMTPEAAHGEVGRMTAWLRFRLDEILTLAPEDVDEFDAGIRDVWRMNARWPRIEKPRYSDMPCPASGCDAPIAVYPPAVPWGVKSVTCDNGHYYLEEEYDELAVQLIAQRIEAARLARMEGGRKGGLASTPKARSEEQRAADVRAHLWRKYGGTAREEPA